MDNFEMYMAEQMRRGKVTASELEDELSDAKEKLAATEALFTNFLEGNLTEIVNEKAKSIRIFCFYNLSSLKCVDLHNVTAIGGNAFYGCTSLSQLILRYSGVVALSATTAFTRSGVASGTGYIYVPDELVDSYKAAKNWKTYAAQIKPISELPSE